jgi:GT2 family glycosyltransferase
METKPQVSFIIVNYKSKDCLQKCLASILNNVQNITKEVFVINNCNDSLKLQENIRLITVLENKGFGHACNIGARETKSDILCFLNPDEEIISYNLDEIISEFKNNGKIGIIGPKLVDENDVIQEWCAGKEITLLDIIGNNLGYKRSQKIWKSEKTIECAWVSGTCLFIRKELFEKLKGFDEKFFMYFEDADLCKRAENLGYKIIYHPNIYIRHIGGKSFTGEKEQKKLYYQSQDYYSKKHLGKIRANLLKLVRRLVLMK